MLGALQAEVELLLALRLRQIADMYRKRARGQQMIPAQRLSIRRLDLFVVFQAPRQLSMSHVVDGGQSASCTWMLRALGIAKVFKSVYLKWYGNFTQCR